MDKKLRGFCVDIWQSVSFISLKPVGPPKIIIFRPVKMPVQSNKPDICSVSRSVVFYSFRSTLTVNVCLNFRALNLTVFHSCLPTISQGLLTLFCFAIVCLSCSSNPPWFIICWVWFNMYLKTFICGGKLYVWTSHPLRLWTPEETSAELEKPLQRRQPSVCESSLMRQLLSCVAHLHLWWLLF